MDQQRSLRATLTCVALTCAVVFGIPYLAASEAHAVGITPASAPAAPASSGPRAERLTPIRAAKVSLGSAVKAKRVRTVKVIGRAGIPSAGVQSVKAVITVKSTRGGTVVVWPTGKGGNRTAFKVRAGRSTSKTLTKVIGTGGRWSVQNRTRGRMTASLSFRGFSSNSVANSATPCGRIGAAPAWEHVVWVVFENHGPAAVAAQAPYLRSLADKCGSATNMWARTHPSLPNYIALTSGSTQGITDSGLPAAHPLNTANLFNQLGANWRTLAQSMPANCHKQNSQAYAARHNPATYYTNLGGTCQTQNVPMGSTPDLSAKFTLVVPDNDHNGHDKGLDEADAWARSYVPKILDSAQYRAGRTAVFVFFDEDSGTGAVENNVNMFVASPSTPVGARVSTRLTHYSTLRATEEMLGLGLIGGAASANDMRGGFRLS